MSAFVLTGPREHVDEERARALVTEVRCGRQLRASLTDSTGDVESLVLNMLLEIAFGNDLCCLTAVTC